MPLVNHVHKKGLFGPTKRGKFYLPKSDHGIHSHAKRKTKWCVTEGYEFDVFYQCDDIFFYCSRNDCFFGIIDEGTIILGKDGERLAKFPKTSNVTDPWHGYPITSAEIWNRPCDCMLELWEQKGIIGSITRKRIEKGWL